MLQENVARQQAFPCDTPRTLRGKGTSAVINSLGSLQSIAPVINNTANDESQRSMQRDSLVGRGKSSSSCRSASVIYVARHPRRILRDYLRILADLSPLYRQLCLCYAGLKQHGRFNRSDSSPNNPNVGRFSGIRSLKCDTLV